jgi:hypothetical protein
VTDKLTGLIWLQDNTGFGQTTWEAAITVANNLKAGDAGLTDGSQAGDWRLPNVKELQSLIDYGRYNPAFPAGHPFTAVEPSHYWSSTTFTHDENAAWGVYFNDGAAFSTVKSATGYVWCVRGGK